MGSIPSLGKHFLFYLTSNTSNKRVNAWMAEWLRHWIQDPMCICSVGSNLTLGKQFLFNFKYFNQMCKCLDGRVVKALDLRSDVHLHAWVRIPLLAITFFCLMICLYPSSPSEYHNFYRTIYFIVFVALNYFHIFPLSV